MQKINEYIQKILAEVSGELSKDTLFSDYQTAKKTEQIRLAAKAEQ